ncbi:hypothetical protein HPP92_023790 [Vanilla planifolia]|uniref:Uncharacterized protein n=1 Tax=Vanilla planifolia TaxID=51239 RepID=A0A835UAV8_VANPL|nr:hypothetical protein HPP92_024144 [Vanilla planifolia]KAG0456002.1 hypothetical protein HPP92_023790 [Vanilla planifolia]
MREIMAAAEARAGWQRAANRCLVQEDAKRAPKLACCPSSSSSQQCDSNNESATNGQDKCISNFVPLNWNHMNSNLPPDTKWWLQIQPNHGCQKEMTYDQKESLPDESGDSEESLNPASCTVDEMRHDELMQTNNKNDCPSESFWVMSAISTEQDSEAGIQDLKDVSSSFSQQFLNPKVDLGDCFFESEHFVMKTVHNLSSKQMDIPLLDLDVPWEENNRPEPWWLVSHKEQLASLVAQKSLENIENCDLPRPAHIRRNPFSSLESHEGKWVFPSQSYVDASMCCPLDYPKKNSTSKDMDGKYLFLDHANGTTLEDKNLQSLSPGSNPSRSQLLEALCHSQTRARKAEMEAQKAHDEKNHIVKLLFKQASHLFAYKQWLQLLQLESLCLQLRIKDHQLSTILPLLPWMPSKGKPMAKHSHDPRRKGKKHKKCRLCKYAFLLAVGVGLAGVGLLLGCCFS